MNQGEHTKKRHYGMRREKSIQLISGLNAELAVDEKNKKTHLGSLADYQYGS